MSTKRKDTKGRILRDGEIQKADGDMGELMLRAVTEGMSYEHISPPCCKEIWYAAYRRFFWLLDKARK